MKVDLGIWGKLTWVVIGIAMVAGLALVVGWYLPLIKKNEYMRQRIYELSNQIRQEQAAEDKLRNSIDAVQHDPKTVERLAREKLGYARPGEIIVRFEPAASNSTHP